jgi:hypothetical protein
MLRRTIQDVQLINEMEPYMKMKFVLVALIAFSSVAAQASPTAECLGKPAAWLRNVLSAVHEAHYTAVTADDVQQTSNDYHDPVYEVSVGNGKTVTVSCDDSGDNDCECSVSN